MARFSVMVSGSNEAAGGIPPEVDRLTQTFVAALRAAGCEVNSATCHATINSLRSYECDAESPPATSDSPHSDLPVSAA